MPKSFHNPHEYDAEYILIPGGRYKYSETGQIESVPDMYFAKYPATNRQYRRFIRYLNNQEPELQEVLPAARFCDLLSKSASSAAGFADYLGDRPDSSPEELRSNCDAEKRFNGVDQPVVGVSWFAARAYCFWLTELARAGANSSASQATGVFRLPTEIEWEWAASGGKRVYPWGRKKATDKLANYDMNVWATTPVGRYPDGATPEGLMDMAGNVWEWMENRYYKDKDFRSLRGGSWCYADDVLRCSSRAGYVPADRDSVIGFRVVRSQS